MNLNTIISLPRQSQQSTQPRGKRRRERERTQVGAISTTTQSGSQRAKGTNTLHK